jgi:hypothetical protein
MDAVNKSPQIVAVSGYVQTHTVMARALTVPVTLERV